MIALLLIRAYTPAPTLVSEMEQSRIAGRLLGLAGELRDGEYGPRERHLRFDGDVGRPLERPTKRVERF
jgi:hypothetical protein